MTEVDFDWELDSLLSTITGQRQNAEDVRSKLSKAISKCTNHEVALRTRERVTRFIRSTNHSDVIAHNERIKSSLEKEVTSICSVFSSP